MVLLPQGYCIDSTEVTREQYAAWLSTNPSISDQPPQCAFNDTFVAGPGCFNELLVGAVYLGPGNEKHPQICVDWCDAYAYCKGVGKRLCGRIGGGPSAYFDDYDKASASQWYNACSSGGINAYPYGNTFDPTACNGGNDRSRTTVQVGSMPGCQSELPGYRGVYDLSANVWEWEDCCERSNGFDDLCLIRGGMFTEWPPDVYACDISPSMTHRGDRAISFGFRCCAP